MEGDPLKFKRIAIYARVSTNDQTADNQLRDLREFCEHGKWIIKHEYVDTGISGCKESRPQLNEMMKWVRLHRYDAVLVWSFDRFARSIKHLITALDEMRENKTEFISYQQCINTATSQGRMVFTIIGAMAEFERELIRERTRAGLRMAVAKGIKLGRPNLPQPIIESILQLKGQRSHRDIAKMVGVGKGTVYRVLAMTQNPTPIVAFSTDEVPVGI